MNENRHLARLDPRTVAKQRLLERAGPMRPAASFVILGTIAKAAEVVSKLEGGGLQHQVLVAAAPHETDQVRKALAGGDGASRTGPQPVVVDIDERETWPARVNRTAASAIGELVILVVGSCELSAQRLEHLVQRFRQDPGLGIRYASKDGAGLAIRGNLWLALGGLDDTYKSLRVALRDLALRARAIGYEAPRTDPHLPQDAGTYESVADRELFAGRLSAAPDRSKHPTLSPLDRPRAKSMALVTSISNAYDTLKPQSQAFLGGSESVAFLDAETAAAHLGKHRGWRVAQLSLRAADPRRGSRFYKANSHLALPGCSVSLWVDASISIVSPLSLQRLAELFLADADICVFQHHARHSIYEEAEACKFLGLDDSTVIDAQVNRYRSEGMPPSTGLAELPVILRRHTPEVCAFNEAWWAEIIGGSHRDQLSFNFVAWERGLRYARFPLSLSTHNGLFIKLMRQS